jgi:hypothetical protein
MLTLGCGNNVLGLFEPIGNGHIEDGALEGNQSQHMIDQSPIDDLS